MLGQLAYIVTIMSACSRTVKGRLAGNKLLGEIEQIQHNWNDIALDTRTQTKRLGRAGCQATQSVSGVICLVSQAKSTSGGGHRS